MTKTAKRQRGPNTDVRILPAVIGVGAILFALKAGGLAFGADAATTPPAPQTETAQPAPPAAQPTTAVAATPIAAPEAPATPEASSPTTLPNAGPDPLAAINAALPNQPGKPLIGQPDNLALNGLPADSPDRGISAAEVDVLTSLSERRDALDQRQRELDLKASVIAVAEKRIDDKIGQLKTLQTTIERLLGQRDAKEVEQLDGLVRIYAAMKPKDAARIFATLDNDVRIGVAGRMKPDTMAGIMSSLPAEVAQKMTVELAGRYKMAPELSSAAAAAVAPPPAPAPAAQPAARPGG